MRLLPCAAALLLLTTQAASEVPVRTVEVWGEAAAEADRTDRQTRRAALDDARVKAIERGSGVQVRGAGLYVSGLERVHLVQSLARGYVIGEEVLEWRSEAQQESPTAPPLVRYRVRIRALVARPSHESAAHLKRAELNRGAFEAGEQAELTLATEQDVWIYVFHLSSEDRGTLLFPNPAQRANRIPGGGCLRFPSPESGVVLEVSNAPGENETREAFLVLAFPRRTPVEEHLGPGEAYSVPELYRRLLRLSVETADARLLPYSVHAGPASGGVGILPE